MAALGPPYYATMGTLATLFGPRDYSTSKQTMSQLAAPTAPRPEDYQRRIPRLRLARAGPRPAAPS